MKTISKNHQYQIIIFVKNSLKVSNITTNYDLEGIKASFLQKIYTI